MTALIWPILRAFGVLSMVAVVPLAISRCSLSSELTGAKTELALKTERVKTLESTIALQNQAVETLNAQTKAAEARFERASKIAETQNKKLDRTIEQLKAAKGTNCNDAMPLVDEIIRRN